MTLKKAKAISNNRIEFFSSEDLSKKIASLALLEELKQSVENDCEGFEVYYQPQLRAGNYDLYGVEALLRYNSKTRGKVFPDEFIPVLEQSGLIKDVGMWVLEQALSQCKEWRKTLPNLRVSVNFSVLQFEDPYLAEKVVEKVREAKLTGDALTVEITESMEIHNSEQILHTMKYMKEYHINFSIDDFGTGYSNLGYLKHMNVDEIKIDRVFVSGIEKDTYNHNLISNVIEFAKGNAIRTC
jgi:EAL domain-containing protein (putative c-di-GMP-specific phosphodiesterase class I)